LIKEANIAMWWHYILGFVLGLIIGGVLWVNVILILNCMKGGTDK
jgi:hypothetical protein